METDKLKKEILSGKIFIYPTDTIYGIGCNAEDITAVNKIKKIKLRDKNKPLSVIAPSIKWINKHLEVDVKLDKYLPGPYTLLLKKKNKDFLNHVSETNLLGIRIPDNEICKQIQESGVPFITTSVNLSGEPFATEISTIPKAILNKIDNIIDIGKLSGTPSTLIINEKEIKR